MRPTNQQRERTLHKLQSAYVDGLISADTLEARAAIAYRSRSIADLSRVLGDIPTRMSQLRKAYEEFFWPEGRDSIRGGIDVALPSRRSAAIVLGRHPSCDIVLEHCSVSRRHLQITFDGRRWEANDLGSTNGTSLNGRRLIRTQTAPGDVLQLGECKVRLV
ncbi:MAG: signal peptide protein [Solirubrobacterales bacterium]|nr:signal peptide protein [Solirubrobacterales bacterium]